MERIPLFLAEVIIIIIITGHVERMDEYSMARRMLVAKVSEGRVRGRPRLGWMDGVKVALGNRGTRLRLRVNARKLGKGGVTWYISN